ncbi:MAG: glycosyltransferase [Brumimicrobium sp.]|nr:glycosyltransferase [Brumimicrobium sp.]
MSHKVLYISYDGLTDPLGQSQILPYLKGLSSKGLKFHIISFEKKENFIALKDDIASRCEECGIIWHPLSYTKKPPLFSTLKDLRKMNAKAIQLQKKEHFDVVHCRSDIPALTGRRLQKKYGLKFIFDMRGFWADERVEGKIWNLKNPLFKWAYNYFKKKETEFFASADAVISLTENGKKEILSWKVFSQKPPYIEVIPCCVDTEKFDPEKIDPEKVTQLKRELHLTASDFILGYVGSIGTWYMLDEMLDYYKIIRIRYNEPRFLFISGESEAVLKQKALLKGIPQEEIVVKRVPHSAVPLHLSLFDFSIFFIRPTFSKKASSPTKQGELMALGIPVICNAGVGDTDAIVKKYDAGKIIKTLNKESYSETVLNKNEYNLSSLRNGAIEVYSLEKGVNKYLSVYQNLLKTDKTV